MPVDATLARSFTVFLPFLATVIAANFMRR